MSRESWDPSDLAGCDFLHVTSQRKRLRGSSTATPKSGSPRLGLLASVRDALQDDLDPLSGPPSCWPSDSPHATVRSGSLSTLAPLSTAAMVEPWRPTNGWGRVGGSPTRSFDIGRPRPAREVGVGCLEVPAVAAQPAVLHRRVGVVGLGVDVAVLVPGGAPRRPVPAVGCTGRR